VSNIFARKSMAVLKAEAEETEAQALVTHGGLPLKRTLSAWSLISLGIGCIIGAASSCSPAMLLPPMPVRQSHFPSCLAA
jgi:hypothetical protein